MTDSVNATDYAAALRQRIVQAEAGTAEWCQAMDSAVDYLLTPGGPLSRPGINDDGMDKIVHSQPLAPSEGWNGNPPGKRCPLTSGHDKHNWSGWDNVWYRCGGTL